MGERKVLNKYIPADFDPKLVPRGKKPKDDLVSVRMMLPFSIQCDTCSSFLYRGRKFNSKKEAVKGPEGKYLGIQRYRFYIKCTACSRPLTFLTDPKNTDYEMESGGTRNYEVHKDRVKKEEANLKDKELEEKEDPMKALENRVLASQREMADLDNLDEIKAMNMRHLKMMSALDGGANGKGKNGGGLDAAAAVLSATDGKKQKQDEKDLLELDEEDEALVKSIQFGMKRKRNENAISITRLGQVEEDEMQKKRKRDQELLEKQQLELSAKAIQKKKESITGNAHLNPTIKIKKRKRRKEVISTKKEIVKKVVAKDSDSDESSNGDALGLLGGYGSDSDSSDSS